MAVSKYVNAFEFGKINISNRLEWLPTTSQIIERFYSFVGTFLGSLMGVVQVTSKLKNFLNDLKNEQVETAEKISRDMEICLIIEKGN